MTLYESDGPPRETTLKRVGRVFGFVLLVLIVVATGFGGGIYLWLHEAVGAIKYHEKDTKAVLNELAHTTLPNQPTIALVLGYDHRTGQGNAPSRSDTMMLLRADPTTKTISMLSLPRDLEVDIKCPSKGDLGLNKINAAYSFCGAPGALATVKALTGLPINYLITVDFRGFKKIVNILQGVWVNVDRRYFNNQGGPYGYATINLQPGYQKLTGGSALNFVRFRHTDSDIYRVARQQLFVQAMKEQFASSFSVADIPSLVGAVENNVEIAVPGGKLDLAFLRKYADFARSLPSGHFFQAKISDLTGSSSLSAPTSDVQAAVHGFLTPNLKQQKDANTVALGGKVKQPKVVAPKPAQTTIVVLNGNGVPGAAADASFRLGQRGYHMLQPPNGQAANAPAQVFHTQIYYLPWSKRGKAAAEALANVLAPADPKPIPRSLMALRGPSMLTVVVGSTYHNALTPPPAPPPVIKHTPPSVTFDRSASEGYVTEAQRKVPFPLMVPTQIESSSSPDSQSGDVPVRVYDISGKQKAVVLVYRRGGVNEYWDVEETAWQGAPVLAERSFHRLIDGRSYSLYYHGTALHMVVLHVGGTGYWAINTLNDSLSNETMLAIAKGLQPLTKAKGKK
ncbi:MAG TPA: LCP family protein [Gaiellaceae bacterium]|jgi:LCP family protein required for cell wall assembly|nr:LCP family protein [Gaiellaceae bacterium]